MSKAPPNNTKLVLCCKDKGCPKCNGFGLRVVRKDK